MNIGIIFGGRSGEHQVSLLSARSILNSIDPEKYDVTQIGITEQGMWLTGEKALTAFEVGDVQDLIPVTLIPEPGHSTLIQRQTNSKSMNEHVLTPDVFFPVLHGTFGEDGTIQGLLEMAGVAYVGAGVLASAVAMDKALFKDLMVSHQIPVVHRILINRKQIETDFQTTLNLAESIGSYPLFIKPANLGSSVGVTKCYSQKDIQKGLLEAARFDERILIEQGIDAREIEVSVLGNHELIVSIPGEVIPADEFYSYHAKYEDDRTQLIVPAQLSPELIEEIQQIAIKAYRVINCRGMARVDFLIEKDNRKIYLNELNTIPGFTKVSMYPRMWAASGIPYPELVSRLINLALEEKLEREQNSYVYKVKR